MFENINPEDYSSVLEDSVIEDTRKIRDLARQF